MVYPNAGDTRVRGYTLVTGEEGITSIRIHHRLELEGTEPGVRSIIDGTLLPARRCSKHSGNLVINRILIWLEERIDSLDSLDSASRGIVAFVPDIECLGIERHLMF
jgi:hypothetical protein